MNYYILEPEVPGGLGVHTVMDRSTHPPIITRLHYELDGWLGDELLATFPCYIVTQGVREKFKNAEFTGLQFDIVEVTKSELFEELYPNRHLPTFSWLKVTGKAGNDDFGLSERHRLVVSERVLTALQSAKLSHCEITNYEQEEG